MRYNHLGQSGLVVSELCLGAMTFGNRPSVFNAPPTNSSLCPAV